ncbi:phage distal tail protein [Actinomadura litoris]|uniref:Phage tail family protein n=1 Tax=Actinomadura litoris TaxID=2678616 RepID=A0A7K1LAF1_9ACTN|nr:phage tail domain-containing protein [Actinomadura litoris]MUN41399.1 phage tail family protein [Actinomadura litoris]
MPILVRPTVVTPPAPTYRPAVTVITDPSGRDWPLDGTGGIWRQAGRKGFHAPTYQHYRDDSPAVDGSFWRGVRATARDLFIPIVIRAGSREELVATRRALIGAVSPRRGECVISTVQPDLTRRSIRARYASGMEGEEGKGGWGVVAMTYGLLFTADDPYMFGDEQTLKWGSDAVTRTEIPIPGADTFYEVVSAAHILGASTVINTGDVDAYPIWKFTGPFDAITLTNDSTGATLTITWTATGTDSLTIDTTPGATTVVDGNGVNRWDKLSAGYQLWPLAPLENDLTLDVTGSTAATRAQMTYRPRFESD